MPRRRTYPDSDGAASVIVTTLSRNHYPGWRSPAYPDLTRVHTDVGCPREWARPLTRTGPTLGVGPVPSVQCAFAQLDTAVAHGVVCEGRLVGRPEHAPAQARPHPPGSSPCTLRCSVTDVNTGDAVSARWIAFLGRACRRHRQLLSTQGNGGVFRYRSPSSISPLGVERNPI